MTDFRQEMAIAVLLGAAFCGAAVGMDNCARHYRNRDPQVSAENQRQARREIRAGAEAYIAKYDLKGSIEHFVSY